LRRLTGAWRAWGCETSVRQNLLANRRFSWHTGQNISALAFYHNAQAAAKDDVTGAKAIVEDLKVRFPGTSKRWGDAAEGEA
jgi:hypothetical protein